jgi:hypothetical protein
MELYSTRNATLSAPLTHRRTLSFYTDDVVTCSSVRRGGTWTERTLGAAPYILPAHRVWEHAISVAAQRQPPYLALPCLAAGARPDACSLVAQRFHTLLIAKLTCSCTVYHALHAPHTGQVSGLLQLRFRRATTCCAETARRACVDVLGRWVACVVAKRGNRWVGRGRGRGSWGWSELVGLALLAGSMYACTLSRGILMERRASRNVYMSPPTRGQILIFKFFFYRQLPV